MTNWKELTTDLTELLSLDSKIISVKRLEKKEGLEEIEDLEHPKTAFTYCQLPYLVRKQGKTIGITMEDATPLAKKMQLSYRCVRIQGLAPFDKKQAEMEVTGLTGFWFNKKEVTEESMKHYPKVSPIEALVMSPLEEEKFTPDYILLYANGAQMALLLNGLQYFKYEQIKSYFIGEGSCADALPRAVATNAPVVCLPCVGERSFGLVKNDELVLAMPADRLERTVNGLKALTKTGLTYPIFHQEPEIDVTDLFTAWYPKQD